MSLRETGPVTTPYCPSCEPRKTGLLEIRWCEAHVPDRRGADDDAVASLGYLSGSSEAGGEDNRAWCSLIHRKKRLLTRGGG